MANEPDMLMQCEAAEYLRVSVASFRRHVHPHVVIYVGRSPRYRKADLDEHLLKRKDDPAARPPKQRRRRVRRADAANARRTSQKAARIAQELG